MPSYLFKVTTKKALGKLPAGANVEIIRNNKSLPTSKEILTALMVKYGSIVPSSLPSHTVDIVLCN